MTKEDIQLLYEYDRWANARALRQCSVLTAEQFTRDLGGSFASVRDTLLHIIAGEWIWLNYWKGSHHDAARLAELRTQREAIFHPNGFQNSEAVRSRLTEIENEMKAFIESQTRDSLERLFPVRTGYLKLAYILQHVANHSTYHRGQVALMMRQLGAEPLASDFHVFLVER